MPDNRDVSLLNEYELRQVIASRQMVMRQERLAHYRATGRAITLIPKRDKASEVGESLAAFGEETITANSHPIHRGRVRQRKLFDRLLIAFELAVLGGLALLIFGGISQFRHLHREVSTAFLQPTLTPTPLIVAVILPKGRDALPITGDRQPSKIEMPGHMRSIVGSAIDLPVPTHAPEQGIRIRIPAIGVDAAIVQGDSPEQLKKGVAQHLGTPNPGQNGNLVLSGHNDAFGEVFRGLDKLHPGDAISVYTNQHEFTYIVSGTRIVSPTQVDVMDPTKKPTVTLISCYPYLVDDQRIVISANLQVD
jgi:sortase A